ncbi:MAG: glycosyltransferase family 2 protein [Planctomycetota bacterium]|jgi:hypothetical protein
MMMDLGIYVVAWKRPRLLQMTLDSLGEQQKGLNAEVVVSENEACEEISRICHLHGAVDVHMGLLKNEGINGALEHGLEHMIDRHRYVLVSDADMFYRQPLRLGIDVLERYPFLGAVSFQDSPEHPALEVRSRSGGTERIQYGPIVIKAAERGSALMFRQQRLHGLRPFPTQGHHKNEFDWWALRDAPNSLMACAELIGVIPDGAIHLGWRKGDSTWQRDREIPEFEEHKRWSESLLA